MANYHCILLDLDNTLLDFDAGENKALSATLAEAGIQPTHELLQKYHKINAALWAQLEKGQIRREQIASERFVRFLKQENLPGNGVEIGKSYHKNLALQAVLVPDALEVLRELAEVATLAVVTNGFVHVQTSRIELSGIGNFIDDAFISEKIGVDKPHRKVFDTALATLGIEQRERVLVVGDSLSSDIKGAQNAGLDSCWFNSEGAQNTTGITPTVEIRTLTELYKIVMEVDEIERIGIKNRKHSL